MFLNFLVILINYFNSLNFQFISYVLKKEYKKPLFDGESLEKKASSIYQALCLPVSVDELLQANQLGVRMNLNSKNEGVLELSQSVRKTYNIGCVAELVKRLLSTPNMSGSNPREAQTFSKPL